MICYSSILIHISTVKSRFTDTLIFQWLPVISPPSHFASKSFCPQVISPRLHFAPFPRTRNITFVILFASSPGKQSPYIFSKFDPLNTNTLLSNGHRTEWSPIRSVIKRMINKIGPRSGSPICLITSMITGRIGRHEVLLPINHNFNKICDIIGYQNKRNSKFCFASSEKKKPFKRV